MRDGRANVRAFEGVGELSAGGALGALIDDAADAVREGRMADAVQRDLGDGALAVERLGRGLVINGVGQAFERALAVGGTLRALVEGFGGRAGTVGERERGREGAGVGRSEPSEGHTCELKSLI